MSLTALILPWMEINPFSLMGTVPLRIAEVSVDEGLPGERKKLSMNVCVGVMTVRAPTLTTPDEPTTIP